MTLMSAAEYRRGEEIALVGDEVRDHVSPAARAEAFVTNLEGTEDDPAVIEDPKHQALHLEDDVYNDARDCADCYTDSDSLAEEVGRALGDEAYDLALQELRASPCITFADGEGED